MAHSVVDKKRELLAAFAMGMTVIEAAKKAGVGTTTVYRWANDDPEFSEAVSEARDRADDEVESVTYANCLDLDPANNTLRMFWLKSRRRDVYGEKQTVEHTGANGGPIEFTNAIDRIYGDVRPDGPFPGGPA